MSQPLPVAPAHHGEVEVGLGQDRFFKLKFVKNYLALKSHSTEVCQIYLALKSQCTEVC